MRQAIWRGCRSNFLFRVRNHHLVPWVTCPKIVERALRCTSLRTDWSQESISSRQIRSENNLVTVGYIFEAPRCRGTTSSSGSCTASLTGSNWHQVPFIWTIWELFWVSVFVNVETWCGGCDSKILTPFQLELEYPNIGDAEVVVSSEKFPFYDGNMAGFGYMALLFENRARV